MAISNKREYRDIELRAEESGDYIVKGYATTFDDPYVMFEDENVQYKEMVSRNALEGADMSDVIFLLNHQGSPFARNSNNTLKFVADEKGLYIEADLSSTTNTRALYEDIKAGLLTKMSWAFTVDADEYDRATHTRTISRIKKVYDVSVVSMPADPNTSIAARDYFNGVIEAEKRSDLNLAKAKAQFKLRRHKNEH